MFQVLRFSLILGLISLYSAAQSARQPNTAPQPASSQAKSATEVPASGNDGVISTPSLLEQAQLFYRRGDFDSALAKYQGILKDHPQSPDAYAGMVQVYLKQKRVEEAAKTSEQGMAQTNSPRLRVARAEVWFRQGRIYEAEKEWVDIINSGSPEARAYLGLARVRDALMMYKTAKKLLDRAHELDSSDPDIEEEWVGTLSRAERIKYLETALGGQNNWDASEREDTASYLEYLKERAKQKVSPCRLVSTVSATETPLVPLLSDPQHLRGYGLAVFLNGHKSSIMLDTGASGILVKRGIAEHAGISKITATKVSGIGKKGRRNAYVGVADSIKIGELEFRDCPIEVMESRSVVGEDGLVGADVFEDFLVDIDFPNEKLKLQQLPPRPGEAEQKIALKSEEDDSDRDEDMANSDAKQSDAKSAEARNQPSPYSGPQDRYIAPEMQSYTRIFRFGHQLLIPTSIGKVREKLFVLDTGSLTNFISPAAAREVTKVHGDSDTVVEGISGRVDKVFSANKAVLTFGHLRQENQDMTAFDTKPISDDVGTEISGFLGFTTLRFLDIKIDYRDALVDFQYKPRPWDR